MKWVFVVCLLLCAALVVGARPINCSIENCTGLVGLWRLEEGSGAALNAVSGGPTGSVTGNPVRGVPGKVGLAYDFDGSGDEVQIDLGTTSGPMTYAFWFKSDDTSVTKRIVDRSWQTGTYSMGTDHIAGNLDVLMVDSGTTQRFLSNAAVLQSGQWYFVTQVINDTLHQAYVDGVFSKSQVIPAGGARADSNDLFIGSAAFNFAGIIDEVYFFNRSLSSEEVSRLHNIATLPNTSLFSVANGSTDFYTVQSTSAVEGMVLANSAGSITWAAAVDARDADFDAAVLVGDGFVAVNSSALDQSVNSSAVVSLDIGSCGEWSVYSAEGFLDSADSVISEGVLVGQGVGSVGSCSGACSNVTCVGGVISFTASHFSSFGVANVIAVPEFHEWALMVLLGTAIAGIVVMRRN